MNSRTKKVLILLVTGLFILISTTDAISASYGTSTKKTVEIPAAELAQDQEPVSGDKLPVFLNMKKGAELSPEWPDMDSVAQRAACPAKLEPMYPRLPGRFINKYVESSIGTPWVSRKITSPIFIEFQATFRVYITSSDENIGSARFAFTLRKNNNEIIASTDFTNGVGVDKDEVVEVRTSTVVNLSINAGDKLYLYIDYWVNGNGLYVLYDAPGLLSGVELICDALNIVNVHADKNGICTDYKDAFFASPSKMIFMSKVDEIQIDTIPEHTTTDDGLRQTHWEYKLKEGDHAVEVRISYGSVDNTTMAIFTGNVNVPKEEVIELFGIELEIWLQIIGVIILLIIIIGIVKVYRRRREEKMLAKYLEETEGS
jgi:hypothetical protein